MDRRSFITRVAGVTAVGEAATAAPGETRTVAYKVKGFTCITCAVGLETMLKGLPGVTRVKASYPENTAVVSFDEHAVSEKTIREFIRACGFAVAV